MSKKTYRKPRVLHYVLRTRGDNHIAHCLDYDLLASGDSEEQAFIRLNFIVRAHLGTAVLKDFSQALLHAAPATFWEEFKRQPKREMSLEIDGLRDPDRNDQRLNAGVVAAFVGDGVPEHAI